VPKGKPKIPPAPKGLGPAGRELWQETWADLGDTWELTAREQRYLRLAAAQADHVADLEQLLQKEGLTAKGSQGQPVLHAALAECRNGRLAIHRLLGSIQVPVDEDEKPEKVTSVRARHAAQVRWSKEADKKRHGKKRGSDA
jgi:hypothetical protein